MTRGSYTQRHRGAGELRGQTLEARHYNARTFFGAPPLLIFNNSDPRRSCATSGSISTGSNEGGGTQSLHTVHTDKRQREPWAGGAGTIPQG